MKALTIVAVTVGAEIVRTVIVGAGEEIVVWTAAVAVTVAAAIGAIEEMICAIALAVSIRAWGKIVGAITVTTGFSTPSFLHPMLNWLNWRTIICPFQTMHHLNSVRTMQWGHYCKLPIPTAVVLFIVVFIVVINLGGK
jgi:hypothetical protein